MSNTSSILLLIDCNFYKTFKLSVKIKNLNIIPSKQNCLLKRTSIMINNSSRLYLIECDFYRTFKRAIYSKI